jgi:hypothetical protein
MVALDDVEVVVTGVRDHLPRGVRKRDRVLLEFRPEVWNLEDAKAYMSMSDEKLKS